MTNQVNQQNNNQPTFDLSQFDEKFAQEEVREPNYPKIPDGKYQVQVERIEMVATQTGNPMIKWQLHIHGPHHAGQKLWKNSVITEKTLGMIKTDLTTCGINMDNFKFSQIQSRFPELLDIGLEVQKKTTGTDSQGRANVNIYFNSRLDAKFPPIEKGGATGMATGPTLAPGAPVTDFDFSFDAGDLPF